MKTKNPCILGAALLLAAALASPAAAQDRDLYLGASLGGSFYSNGCDNALGGSCDDKDVAGRVFLGREFMPYVSGEIGFVHFGTAEVSGVGETKAYAGDISVLVTYPVDRGLSIFGRLGAYRAALETEAFGVKESQRNSAWTYGIGAQYNVSRELALRAEWQRYANVGDQNTGRQNLDFTSIGLVWHF